MDLQEIIYNVYLAESRKAKNLPYKKRKNFQNLNETVKLCLLKLERLFRNNPDINLSDFFKAPYHIYPEGETFLLDFFVTQKAIKVYKMYKESKNVVDEKE